MPRRPGTLVRATCCVCGTVELASGASNFSRCTACKADGRYSVYHRRYDILGKTQAGARAQQAVRDGLLPRPSTLLCADCSRPACEYEHRDYNKPLAVDPICRSCNLKRGPAIPVEGSLQEVIRRGIAPYRLRCHAIQLFRRMGLPVDSLAAMPAKLSHSDWLQLLPKLATDKVGA